MKVVARDAVEVRRALNWLEQVDSVRVGMKSMFGEEIVFNTQTLELEKANGYERQVAHLLLNGILFIRND